MLEINSDEHHQQVTNTLHAHLPQVVDTQDRAISFISPLPPST